MRWSLCWRSFRLRDGIALERVWNLALGGLGLLVATCLPAQQPSDPVLAIRDLRPKFLEFYQTAIKETDSEDRRFGMWKQMYDFAAVPPTPEGDQMARRVLDDAWPRHAEALPTIRAG